MVGFLISLTVCLWWGIGAMFVPPRPYTEMLPITADGCMDSNITLNGINETFVYNDIITTEAQFTATTYKTTPSTLLSNGFTADMNSTVTPPSKS